MALLELFSQLPSNGVSVEVEDYPGHTQTNHSKFHPVPELTGRGKVLTAVQKQQCARHFYFK